MSDSHVRFSSGSRCSRIFRTFFFGLLAVVVVAGVDVLQGETGIARAETETRTQENLEVGYSLLESSLRDESQLKWLLLMRKLTLNKPPAEIASIMERISETSKRRAAEISKLRRLKPDVSREPAPSPVGDAIQASAKAVGMHEMVFPDGAFNIRFLFLQAQATRMIAVIAVETADLDPNEERSKWLRKLAKEFEGLRDELVKSVENCSPR
ncbi:MAG: hypothetical protein VX574_01790 [Myxococcota bacterium]|nr:hypothetical protein [Myxococcota bacterium]